MSGPAADDDEITILKVPSSVAEAWAKIKQTAGQGNNHAPVKLGTMKRDMSALTLSKGALPEGRHSATFTLHKQPQGDMVPTWLFSVTPSQPANLEGKAAIFNARPQLDDRYTAALVKEAAKANKEKHYTKVGQETIFQRQSALSTRHVVTKVAKQKKLTGEEFTAQFDDLEGQLFDLFKETEHWSTPDIAKRLHISAVQSKKLLDQIAYKIASGPHRGRWQLKPEYRTDEPEAAAAMEQPQG